jgi:hypothetical protein
VSTVTFDMSMSLDGYFRAANPRPEEPLGEGREALHAWIGPDDETGREVLERGIGSIGAAITGRVNYDESVRWRGANGPIMLQGIEQAAHPRRGDRQRPARRSGIQTQVKLALPGRQPLPGRPTWLVFSRHAAPPGPLDASAAWPPGPAGTERAQGSGIKPFSRLRITVGQRSTLTSPRPRLIN